MLRVTSLAVGTLRSHMRGSQSVRRGRGPHDPVRSVCILVLHLFPIDPGLCPTCTKNLAEFRRISRLALRLILPLVACTMAWCGRSYAPPLVEARGSGIECWLPPLDLSHEVHEPEHHLPNEKTQR